MAEINVAHDISHGLRANHQRKTDGLRRRHTYNTLTEMVFGMLAEMRQGFLAVERRFDAIENKLSALEGRLDAISLRLDDIEASCHENAVLIKELRIESNRQHNEVLNALQIGLQNKTALEELTERVAELERRLSSL